MQPSVKKRHHSDLSIIQTIVILPLAGRGLCECCMVLILACTPLSLLSFDHYLTFVLNNRNLTDNTNHYNSLVASVHLMMKLGKIQTVFLRIERRCLSNYVFNVLQTCCITSHVQKFSYLFFFFFFLAHSEVIAVYWWIAWMYNVFFSIAVDKCWKLNMCNNNAFIFFCVYYLLFSLHSICLTEYLPK